MSWRFNQSAKYPGPGFSVANFTRDLSRLDQKCRQVTDNQVGAEKAVRFQSMCRVRIRQGVENIVEKDKWTGSVRI